jgi:hypothetical protein
MATENITTKKPTSTPEKKRTIYSQRSMLELPEWAKNDKTHTYRWTSTRVMARSDGFDRRGWSIAKDPTTGEVVKAVDVILSRMPLEDHDAMMEYKRAEAAEMVTRVSENIEDGQQRLRYEVEKLGGKIGKSEFSLRRTKE